jgi:NAD(P)-dependent dehydrogenase (short-subunit alcohol dehydrogenase family)
VASVFITGSADGLGRLAAQRLVTLGHDIVLHGRDQHRAQEAMRAVPGARTALTGDLASIEKTRALAEQATPPDRSRPSFITRGSFVRTTRVSRRLTDSKTLSQSMPSLRTC